MWKLRYGDGLVVVSFDPIGRDIWDGHPVCGVQVLQKRVVGGTKSRVLWHAASNSNNFYKRVHADFHYYIMYEDGPAGVTPDAVLDAWREKTGATDVRISDLSLDDLASIGVKCGRSIPNEEFDPILRAALDDPDIP